MKTPPREWIDAANVIVRGRAAGYVREALHDLILTGVLGGRVRLRIRGTICPPERLDRLDFDFVDWMVHGWTPNEMLSVEVLEGGGMNISRPDEGSRYELNGIELRAYFAELRKNEAPITPHRNLGGRPGRWNWDEAMRVLGGRVYASGLVEREAEAVAFLRDWFAAQTGGETPDDKSIREHSRKLLLTFRNAVA